MFARFKAWLLDIYKTIKGLGKEINPDVRRRVRSDAHRRAAAHGYRRSARKAGPTITEIHEADAKLTEPHEEGERARDRVVAERERYAEEQPPEIQKPSSRAPQQSQPSQKQDQDKELSLPEKVLQDQADLAKWSAVAADPSLSPQAAEVARNLARSSRAALQPGQKAPTIPGTRPEPGSTTERDHPLASGPAPDTLPEVKANS